MDTPLSESRYSEILEGWVQEDREVYDEHDADALNELDNHEHDNEPFEEVPDVDSEEEEEEEEEPQNEEDDDDDHEEDSNNEVEKDEEDDDDDEDSPADNDEENSEEDDDDDEVEESDRGDLQGRSKREAIVSDPEVIDEDSVETADQDDDEDDNNDSVEETEPVQENQAEHVPFEEVNIINLFDGFVCCFDFVV